MVKLFKLISLICLVFSFATTSKAQIEFIETSDNVEKRVFVTGFLHFPPLSEKTQPKNGELQGVLVNFISKHLKKFRFRAVYVIDEEYEDLVSYARRGENIDIIYGIYSQTKMYEGIDILYPSVINNPVTVIMLPSRISEVKAPEDLKGLKGAVSSDEIFSDFVTNEMKNMGIQIVEDTNKLYEMLFTGEIDYVFSSHYYGIATTTRLGLRKKVAFSKQTIWNMPIFYGVSKASKHRDALLHVIGTAVEEQNARKEMERLLKEEIARIERESAGIVPPTYILKEDGTPIE